ncbi:MAG: O-antigen ligase family protein [bacterium]
MKNVFSFLLVNLEKKNFYLMILLFASLPFSESLKEISIFLASLVFLIQLWRREQILKLTLTHYGFFLLVLAATLTTLSAENPRRSLDGLNDILFFTAPFFVAQSIPPKEKNIRILFWILSSTTTLAALIYIGKSLYLNRPLEIPSLGNQNYTAMFLIIVVTTLISLLLFSTQKSKITSVILACFIFILIIAGVMTVMRTSFLALGIYLLILLWHFRNHRWIRLFFIIVCSILLLAIFFVEPMRNKIFIISSLYARFELWKHAIQLFLENPVWGVGLNHFSFTFPKNFFVDAGASYFDAHSLYFQTLSQMGLLGLVAIFLIIYGFLKHWLKIRPILGIDLVKKYAALGAFCVIFMGGIFDHTLHHGQAIAFSILAGFLFGYPAQEENEK